MQEERLSKLMAARGLCSRREADRYIEAGWVRVNGELISQLGTKVDPSSEIELLEEAQAQQTQKVTIVYHKPLGILSCPPSSGYRTAQEMIEAKNQVGDGPVPSRRQLMAMGVLGRLDIDSKGLLVLTEDGTLARRVIGPDVEVEKEYLVRVEGGLKESVLARLRSGLSLDGQKLKPARVEKLGPDLLRFVLKQGKKRQIRRMCEQVDLQVKKLKRVRIGQLGLSTLPPGHWRYLQPGEKIV
jgi:23S rRNA pseudouridine2604 synthase